MRIQVGVVSLMTVALITMATATAVCDEPSSRHESSIPKEKQTKPGLYVTAKEADEKWKAEPGKVIILDVRTPEEFVFVGHPDMALNVPFGFALRDGRR